MGKDDGRSFIEKVIAQWPGAVGLGLIAWGVLILVSAESTTIRSGGRAGLYMIGAGMGFLGYWALANKNDGYNF